MLRLREITEESQRAFFADARAGFARAAAAHSEIRRAYSVGGTVVGLRFAGDALVARMTPALEHLRLPDDAHADLDVCLWDSRSTGVPMVPPPCPQRSFTDRGNIWGFTSERILSAFQYGEFSLNLFDVEERTAVYWVQDAEALPFWTTAAPLRSIFGWWLRANGKHLVHGAVVGTSEGAVLITGKGGSGKSTTALTCLRAGMAYIGDDYVGIGLEPEPRAYSLYCTAKLAPSQAERFPDLAERATVGREGNYEKAVFFLLPELASQLRRELPLTGVLLPKLGGTPATSLAPADRLAVERAAAFTTLWQIPHSGQNTVDFVRRVTAVVPRALVSLGTELDAIPRVIEQCARGAEPFRAVARRGADERPSSGSDRPLVSVVVPVHDGAAFVGEALQSIAAQGYPWLEILVVNDATTDDTTRVLAASPVEHRSFEFETNQGPAEARNRGVREAAGDYLAFLDVDDLWPAGRLERMMDVLAADESIDVVCGRAQMLEKDGAEFRETGDPKKSFPFYVGAALYRRRAFLKNGPFDRTFRFGEDSDWYLRAFENGLNCCQIDDVTLYVRRHERNMTRGKTNLELNQARVFKARLDRMRAREEA
jgi:hypothetical protein